MISFKAVLSLAEQLAGLIAFNGIQRYIVLVCLHLAFATKKMSRRWQTCLCHSISLPGLDSEATHSFGRLDMYLSEQPGQD